MTSRTWIGGHDGNDAGSAANWSPSGAPQPGDNLTVGSGTLAIGPSNLAGNVLHTLDQVASNGPLVLDLNGEGATVGIVGPVAFGPDLTVNAIGQDYLDASGGFLAVDGSINLADHAHLFMTGGNMQFATAGSITGGMASRLTNYGRLEMTNGHVSTLVNGDGTLAFDGARGAPGLSEISAPVTMAQHVELNPGSVGMQLELSDPGDFHALLTVDPVVGRGNVSVQIDGVTADDFAVLGGGSVLLTKGGQADYLLRVNNVPGAFTTTTSFGASDTTITWVTHTPQSFDLGGTLNGAGGIAG